MSKFFYLFLVVLLFLFLGGFLFIWKNSQAISTDSTNYEFVINQGEGINIISQRLEKVGLIRNRYVFILMSYWLGLNKKLQAGLFRLSPSLSTSNIVTKLSTGGSHDYWFKIIEGTRVEEIASQLPTELPLKSSDFVTQVKSKEGYLFPDSYLIPQNYSLDQILAVIDANFAKKLTLAKNDTSVKLSDSQVIILASLLEREARTLKSKQIIAGILLNRLSINMALQVDATAQYARDTKINPKNYWEPISKDNLKINSPFNTYLSPGLPPSPICNPGYDSIYAAYHPVDSDYIYYITGKNGQMYYGTTLEEHNQNIAKYLN